MTRLLRVKARPGIRVPRQGAPRRHITDAAAVVVESSAYYRRQLRDGDLVLAPQTSEDSP